MIRLLQMARRLFLPGMIHGMIFVQGYTELGFTGKGAFPLGFLEWKTEGQKRTRQETRKKKKLIYRKKKKGKKIPLTTRLGSFFISFLFLLMEYNTRTKSFPEEQTPSSSGEIHGLARVLLCSSYRPTPSRVCLVCKLSHRSKQMSRHHRSCPFSFSGGGKTLSWFQIHIRPPACTIHVCSPKDVCVYQANDFQKGGKLHHNRMPLLFFSSFLFFFFSSFFSLRFLLSLWSNEPITSAHHPILSEASSSSYFWWCVLTSSMYVRPDIHLKMCGCHKVGFWKGGATSMRVRSSFILASNHFLSFLFSLHFAFLHPRLQFPVESMLYGCANLLWKRAQHASLYLVQLGQRNNYDSRYRSITDRCPSSD